MDRKIKPKSSLNALNAKSVPLKRKSLPKLKSILANPYRRQNTFLPTSDAFELKEVLHDEVTKSGLAPREFVKGKRISLGLECCLRAISNKKASCVFISRMIKPNFIIGQIGQFAKQRNSSVPVYVVKNLESMCEKVFGVKAVVMVLPLKLPDKLSQWVYKRTITIKQEDESRKTVNSYSPPTLKSNEGNKFNLNCLYMRRQPDCKAAFVAPTLIKNGKQKKNMQIKEWSGDYISFLKSGGGNFEKEREQMILALRKLEERTGEGSLLPKKEKSTRLPKIVYEECDSIYNFTESYKTLVMNKLRQNPNRRYKSKRNKNKRFILT